MTTRRFIHLVALLFAATITIFAQVPASTPEQAPLVPVALAVPSPDAAPVPSAIKNIDVSQVSASTKAKDIKAPETLSVDFPDEEIRNILRNVADLFEFNIVIPETLQGKTTIKLRDVTWRQIFQNVLTPVNYTYIEDGNIIKIISNDSLAVEPLSTEVFILNYAQAAALMPTLTTLVDPALGKIVVDTRSNSLVITERPTRLKRISAIVEQLDQATEQVMIETKFVEVSDRDVKNIGVNWSSLSGYNVKAGPINGTFERNRGQDGSNGNSGNSGTTGSNTNGTTNGSTTTGTSGQNTGSTNSGSITSNNGAITSISATGTTGALTNATTTTTNNGTNNSVAAGSTSSLDFLQSLTNTDSTARTLSTVFSADEFKLVLSALQTQSSTKLVSNPTVVTLNNTTATILIGEKYPIATPNLTGGSGGGGNGGNGGGAAANTITYTITEKDIGIKLEVLPQVNSRGFIKLTVKPSVSSLAGKVIIPQGAEYPIIATRETTTSVSLKDGYTMGIGGLLQTTETKGETRVPVLGSIPGIGRLFRSDTKNRDATNLIIFITAKTISAEGASVEKMFNSDQVRQLNMRREDLPGHRDGSDPFIKAEVVKEAPKSSDKK
jgi:type IV pilus assembly protein PilQ